MVEIVRTNVEDNLIRAVTYVRTLDGDSFVGLLRLAPVVKPKPLLEAAFRVKGWNAAELREAEGPYMRVQFEARLIAASAIRVRMYTMSFERIVSDVYLDDVLFAGILHTALRDLRDRIQ